jgi:hypothetical protein
MIHIHNRWAESWFRRSVYRLSTQWPGICVGQSGNETRFFSECFYFLLSVSFHQSFILINCSSLWRCGVLVRSWLVTSPYGTSQSHSDTPHSARLLWTSDQPETENSTWQHTTLTRDGYPCPPAGFEPIIPASKRPQTHALDRGATGYGS